MALIRLFFIIVSLMLLVGCRTNVSTDVDADETVENSASSVPKSSRDMLLTRGSLAPDFLITAFDGKTYN